MPRYAEQITALLRAMVWGEPLTIDPSVLLEPELWYMARRQQMAHMLAVWAMNNHLPVPNPAAQKMAVFTTLQRQERQNRLLTEIVTLLKEHAITPVLLKGYSIAVLYSNPDMRDSADVDLYIGEKDYDRMIAIVKSRYPEAFWFSEEHAGLHFTMVLDENLDRIVELHRVTMELHNMPRADRAFQQFTLDEMKRTRTLSVHGVEVQIPSKTYNALYVFMHAWHHFAASGVGLRQIADWMLALHDAASEPQLAETLEPVLKQMHMLEIWQTFGYVLVNKLGLPRAEFPLYTDACAHKGEQLYEQLIADGHCGRERKMKLFERKMYVFPYDRPEQGRLKQKVYTFCRLTFQAIQMAKLFPSYAWRDYAGVFF